MAETKKKNQKEYPMALPIGTILKGGKYPYRIEEVLGQGGYGITYKVSARVKSGNIPVIVFFAIKENFVAKYCSRKSDGVTMTYPENCEEEGQRDLNDFVAEGRRLEQLCKGHKNIVNVNETFYANNTAYYTMEYINGGDLCKIVKQNGRLSEHEALNLIAPIIDAVGYVHEQHVMHYDIKPENIMVRKGENGEPDEPVLIDFGIALHYDANGNLTKTSKDRGVGCSDGYAPMEQYAGDYKFSPESDVYALAATLFYLLSGKNPQKAFDITPDWIEKNLPIDVNSQIRSAIIHTMKKLKEDRTQTAGTFMKELGLSDSFQKQTDESNKTYKYKKEQPIVKVDPKYEESVRIRVEQAEQVSLFEGLGFWERFKKARKIRGWFASCILYIGFAISILLLIIGIEEIQTSIEYDNNLMPMAIMFIIPAFAFVALMLGNKWGFWMLGAVGICVPMYMIWIGWKLILPVIVFIVSLACLSILWEGLHKKVDGVSYWVSMEFGINKYSAIIILCFVSLCWGTYYWGDKSNSERLKEQANLDHNNFSHAISKTKEFVSLFEKATTIDAKIDDLLIAKEAFKQAEVYENKWQRVQPEFYSKIGEVQFPLFNYLQETVDSYVKDLDTQKVKDYPRTIEMLQIAKELYPDNDNIKVLYENVIKQSAFMKIKGVIFRNYNDSTIDDYRTDLYAHKMRYLGAMILYDGLTNSSETSISIKIISPMGKLQQGSESPKGYSFRDTLTVYEGKDMSEVIKGWGNSSESIYERGKWKYEIWHEDKNIYSTTFTLK